MRSVIALSLCIGLGQSALAKAAPVQLFKPADDALWFAIVGSGPFPRQPIIQMGPFRDKDACENALKVTDKVNVIEFGVCVPDRSATSSTAP